MATLVCTASSNTQLGNYRVGTWSPGYARQGSYGGNVSKGLVVFTALATTSMLGKEILDISMTFKSEAAGANRSKTLTIRQSTKTAPSGSTTGLVGDTIGSLTGKFYNNTVSINNMKTSNPAFFAAFAEYLQTGARSISLYRSESSSSGNYSTNYLQFERVVLTIEYEESNLYYFNGTAWERCKPYYHDGTAWIPCKAYYHDGTEWKH